MAAQSTPLNGSSGGAATLALEEALFASGSVNGVVDGLNTFPAPSAPYPADRGATEEDEEGEETDSTLRRTTAAVGTSVSMPLLHQQRRKEAQRLALGFPNSRRSSRRNVNRDDEDDMFLSNQSHHDGDGRIRPARRKRRVRPAGNATSWHHLDLASSRSNSEFGGANVQFSLGSHHRKSASQPALDSSSSSSSTASKAKKKKRPSRSRLPPVPVPAFAVRTSSRNHARSVTPPPRGRDSTLRSATSMPSFLAFQQSNAVSHLNHQEQVQTAMKRQRTTSSSVIASKADAQNLVAAAMPRFRPGAGGNSHAIVAAALLASGLSATP